MKTIILPLLFLYTFDCYAQTGDAINERFEMKKYFLVFLNEGKIKGICIYHIEDEEKVRILAESDPAVQAGRLEVEIHPFYSAKGMVLK